MSTRRTSPVGARAGLVRTLTLVGVLACGLQTISATLQQRSFETPNTSTETAETLVRSGEYALGPLSEFPGSPRAYQLPGEPLYLAAGFLLLPPAAWRYLHV